MRTIHYTYVSVGPETVDGQARILTMVCIGERDSIGSTRFREVTELKRSLIHRLKSKILPARWMELNAVDQLLEKNGLPKLTRAERALAVHVMSPFSEHSALANLSIDGMKTLAGIKPSTQDVATPVIRVIRYSVDHLPNPTTNRDELAMHVYVDGPAGLTYFSGFIYGGDYLAEVDRILVENGQSPMSEAEFAALTKPTSAFEGLSELTSSVEGLKKLAGIRPRTTTTTTTTKYGSAEWKEITHYIRTHSDNPHLHGRNPITKIEIDYTGGVGVMKITD